MLLIPISCTCTKSLDVNEILYVDRRIKTKPRIIVTVNASYQYPLDDMVDYLANNYGNIFIRLAAELILNPMYISHIDSYYRTVTFYNGAVLYVTYRQIKAIASIADVPDVVDAAMLDYAF